VSSLPVEATKSLSNLEVGEFVPETFQGDLYQILRGAMRFNVWFNSLPDELKSLVVKPSQQQNGQKSKPRDEGIISDSDVRRIVLLNFALKPQSGNVTPQSAEQEVERVLNIFRQIRSIETNAVEQRKTIENEVKRELQPQESSIDKLAKGARIVAEEGGKLLDKAKGLIQPSTAGPPPPPQTAPPMTPENFEAEQLQKVEPLPRLKEQPEEEATPTFGNEGLPPDESASEPSERPEVVGGSTSEVEKRLGGKKQH